VPAEYATIQAAIDTAQPADEVVIANGVYTGAGNKNLDFGGKKIVVRSASGEASACIIDCEADGRGFHFHNGETGASVVSRLTVRNGQAYGYGGGMLCANSSSPTVTGCRFIGNSILSNGIAAGGGLACTEGSRPSIQHCWFERNVSAGYGGGLSLANSAPNIQDSWFIANTADLGGAIHCPALSAAVLLRLVALGNTARRGAVLWCSNAAPILQECAIASNAASERGGAIYAAGAAAPCLAGCTVTANEAPRGAAFYASAPSSTLRLSNTVIWSHGMTGFDLNGAPCFVTYCDIEGGWPGAGNIDANPLFVRDPSDGGDGWGDDPNTPDVDESANDDFGDLRLLPGSPCIDAGDNATVPPDTFDLDGDGDTTEMLPFDFSGRARFADDPLTTDTGAGTPPIVDMGAYEHVLDGDFELDWTIDSEDFASFASCMQGPATALQVGCACVDMDIDGDADLVDFAAFQAVFAAP
jgi:hypothetical protein